MAIDGSLYADLKPTADIAFCTSGAVLKTCQTMPVRWFSHINMEMPRSIPITSASYQFVSGLNASTNPYFFQARLPYVDRMLRRTATQSLKTKGSEPAVAHGTTVPSMGPLAGGPPQAV